MYYLHYNARTNKDEHVDGKFGDLRQGEVNYLGDVPILGYLIAEDRTLKWKEGTDGLLRYHGDPRPILPEFKLGPSFELLDKPSVRPFGKVICDLLDWSPFDTKHFMIKFRVSPFAEPYMDAVVPGRHVAAFVAICSIAALPSEPHESLGFRKFEVNPEMSGLEFAGISGIDLKEFEATVRTTMAMGPEPKIKRDYSSANHKEIFELIQQLIETCDKLNKRGIAVSKGQLFTAQHTKVRLSAFLEIEDLYQAGAHKLIDNIPYDGPHTFPECEGTPMDLKTGDPWASDE